MCYRSHAQMPMQGPERRQLLLHLQGLANPIRLRILERLQEQGEETVMALAHDLRISQPRVSWHLSLLRRGGLVRQRRAGRQVFCSVDLDAVRRGQGQLWELLTANRRIPVDLTAR
jgi:ArsR family transcriptional regulator, arsenate/arsenite/antimonite-responsive transcriptional repressor